MVAKGRCRFSSPAIAASHSTLVSMFPVSAQNSMSRPAVSSVCHSPDMPRRSRR